MSLPVFTKHQNPVVDTPIHFIGKQFATLVVASRFAQPLDTSKLKRGIQLTTPLSWAAIKEMLRPRRTVGVGSLLNPPTYHTMNFQNYPEPDRVTVWQNHRAFLR
jgi:hypothetical protein